MKKSELLKKIIEIEESKGEKSTITLDYIYYLKEKYNLLKQGDTELK